MRRTDPVYWQRLRRDKRSNFPAGLTLLAWLAPVIGIAILVAPGTQAQSRSNPLYWLVLLPSAWWATSLTSFEPMVVRFIKPAQALAPVVALAAALVATRSGEADHAVLDRDGGQRRRRGRWMDVLPR